VSAAIFVWRKLVGPLRFISVSRKDAKRAKEDCCAMTENEISKVVVDAALKVHRALGPGLLESVYEIVLAHELRSRGLQVQRQLSIPIRYENIHFDDGFRADLVVEQKVIVEIKSVEITKRVHKKQVLTYLRLADIRLGLLINFGTALIRDGITRLVNGLEE
jgi:GxxExxY protein